MLITPKHTMKLYRYHKLDLWGLRALSFYGKVASLFKKVSKFFRFLKLSNRRRFFSLREHFNYRLDIIPIKYKFKKKEKEVLDLRVSRIYFLTLRYRHFRKMSRAAARKDGLFEFNFCFLLEGRLIAFLYRTGFVSNMWEALRFVKQSYVLINRKRVDFPNMSVKLYDILSFDVLIKSKVYLELLVNFKRRRFLFSPPPYIFNSFWFLFSYMYKYPRIDHLVYPANDFDIYRVIDFEFSTF